ncbi:S8 family serine peptidase, partial [candidate division KSB1 bacterium]|nr:S8 family serine peptidase [candidate division KSB1 bacterium]
MSPMVRLVIDRDEVQLKQLKKRFAMTQQSWGMDFELLVKVKENQTLNSIPGVQFQTQLGPIATALASKAGISELAQQVDVQWVEISKYLAPCLDVSRVSAEVAAVNFGNPSYRGKGVIVAVFDSGIDWKHEDFIDEQGKSRILFLWDMTDNAGPHPEGFDYGTEYTQAQINDEIDGTPTGLVREKDSNGHGTHVAGIAAGDGSATGNGGEAGTYMGMAPLADLIIVKGGDDGFTTTNQVNGTSYFIEKAKNLGRPVVINFSLGGHWGPHDGTELHEQAIDAAVGKGQAIIVAASNEGGTAIHAREEVGTNEKIRTNFKVLEDAEDVWIDIWHEGTDRMEITITTPTGYTTPAYRSGSLENWKYWNTDAGRVGLIAPLRNPENQDYELVIWIDNKGGKEIKTGAWYFELKGIQVSKGRFDAYTSVSDVEFTSNVDQTGLVGMPGTSNGAITVAAYVTKNSWKSQDGNNYYYTSRPPLWDISPFSSPGPTRDGRQKPEITAPGHGVVSVLSSDSEPSASRIMPDGVHYLMQGTSMAAPHVAGAAALIFEKKPDLSSSQVKDILCLSGYVDGYTGDVWNFDWGFGKLVIPAAMDLVPGSLPGTTAQHDIGNINVGLSDWGAVGNDCGADPGFQFPANGGADHGYSGSLIAGVWGKDMADSYGTIKENEDDTWRTTSSGLFRMLRPGIFSDQDGYSQFEKMVLTPAGYTWVVVSQHSYSWQYAPDNQFILLDYEIYNAGPRSLKNLVLGFLMDWDCQPNHDRNDAGFDKNLKLAYMWDNSSSGNPYLGTMILSHETASFDIINNENSVYPFNDLPDQVIYDLASSPGLMGSIGQADLSSLIAAPKLNLNSWQSVRFSVALLAGNSLSDLQNSANRAIAKYNSLGKGVASLFYDDGTAEGGAYVTSAGEKFAVKFTPAKYPAVINTIQYFTQDAGGNLLLEILDDNGAGGKPGTIMQSTSLTVTPRENTWNVVDVSNRNLRVTAGDFYVSLKWLEANRPILGYDEAFPHAGRSWYYNGSNWTNFTEDGDPWDKRDLMIGVGFQGIVAVESLDVDKIPSHFYVTQNFPNPFNP